MKLVTRTAHRLTHTRTLVLAAAAVLAVGVAGAAQAYWGTVNEQTIAGRFDKTSNSTACMSVTLTISDPANQVIQLTGEVRKWQEKDRWNQPMAKPNGTFMYFQNDDRWNERPQELAKNSMSVGVDSSVFVTPPPDAKRIKSLCFKNTTANSVATEVYFKAAVVKKPS